MFNPSFREQIESGEVKVITKNGREMTGILFDRHYHNQAVVVAYNEEDVVICDPSSGKALFGGTPDDNLFIMPV